MGNGTRQEGRGQRGAGIDEDDDVSQRGAEGGGSQRVEKPRQPPCYCPSSIHAPLPVPFAPVANAMRVQPGLVAHLPPFRNGDTSEPRPFVRGVPCRLQRQWISTTTTMEKNCGTAVSKSFRDINRGDETHRGTDVRLWAGNDDNQKTAAMKAEACWLPLELSLSNTSRLATRAERRMRQRRGIDGETSDSLANSSER